MKKGFALLETIIVITFLSVSLLMLYGTFRGMISNSEKNILYDDAANIYKVYYLKEYLNLHNLQNLITDENVQEITCNDFSFSSCPDLIKEMHINKIYLTKYDLKEYKKDNYPSYFNNYISTLSNKENLKYRLIVEFKDKETFSYSSISLGGESYE